MFRGGAIGTGFGVYVHWHGTQLPKLVANGMKAAQRAGRLDDDTYAARIIVSAIEKGVFGNRNDDGTGMGLFGQGVEFEDSHNGPMVVDFNTLRVTGRGFNETFVEFLADHKEPSRVNPGEPDPRD
jgi:hypothetical protein